MTYKVCFFVALAIFLIFLIIAIYARKGKGSGNIRPVSGLIIGVYFAATALYIPIYSHIFSGEVFSSAKSLLSSFYNAVKLFGVGGEFNLIYENVTRAIGDIWVPYFVFAVLLFVLAPILTFGVILSLIRNAYAYVSYTLSYFKDIYVFSELNDESIALASSIRTHHPKAAIVYTDVIETGNERMYDFIQKVRSLSGILFKNHVENIRFERHSKSSNITFILIGRNEAKNIRQSLELIEKYKDRDNTELYVFSALSEGELLLADADKGKMKVRRINETSALINRYLYECGTSLFDNAAEGDGGIRNINALIVGVDRYGKEMIKTLAWYCQMDGYRVYINAYDSKDDVLEKFKADCPELLDPEHNGAFDPDDAEYEINIHPGVNVDTASFIDSLAESANAGAGRDVTFAFVATGDDNENVRIATNLRVLFERKGIHPEIVTVVHDSNVNKGLKNIHNFRGQPYDIRFIGSIDDIYSEAAIIGTDLEAEALERHMRWGSEEEFWKYEYNYRSSIAATMHAHAKAHCQIAGASQKEEDLTAEELVTLERIEHRRWNAYMRSEGYVFSGSADKASRNDLAKMHNDLVPYSKLTEEEKRKDSKVAAN